MGWLTKKSKDDEKKELFRNTDFMSDITGMWTKYDNGGEFCGKAGRSTSNNSGNEKGDRRNE